MPYMRDRPRRYPENRSSFIKVQDLNQEAGPIVIFGAQQEWVEVVVDCEHSSELMKGERTDEIFLRLPYKQAVVFTTPGYS